MEISPKIGYNFSTLMSEQHTPPIFYDPRHRRWRRFTRTVQFIAAVGSCIVAVLLASVLINPVLPSLGLPPIRTLPHVHHLIPPQPKPIPNRSARRSTSQAEAYQKSGKSPPPGTLLCRPRRGPSEFIPGIA
jgi:hypothetical protein